MTSVVIHVKGRLDESWSELFEGFTITYSEEDETVLSGTVADQAAVYGLLARLRDLGLPLISVQHSDGEEEFANQP